jgi:hypothetical protein
MLPAIWAHGGNFGRLLNIELLHFADALVV